MFSNAHALKRYAFAIGEHDDVFTEAEELILKWGRHPDSAVEFKSIGEIYYATLLLEDGLLPIAAKKALSKTMRKAINEAYENKLRIKCLYISPPKRGRKENRTAIIIKCREVSGLIKGGMTASKAYEVVAEKHSKSPDTIRRDYERLMKARKKKQIDGEFKK